VNKDETISTMQQLLRDREEEINSLYEEVDSLNNQIAFVTSAYEKQISNLVSTLEEYRG
jgi:flagellar hook-associated protein FlgK